MFDILIGAVGTLFTIGVIYIYAFMRGYSRGIDDAWEDIDKIFDEYFRD